MNEEFKKLIDELPEMCFIGSVQEAKIQDAEKELGVIFADDFVEYTKHYGAVSSEGMEWLGVINSKRLSVVDRTNSYRNLYPSFPKNMYIVEELGIDGAVVLQDSKANLYYYSPYCNDLIYVFDDLCTFLKMKKHSVELEIRIFSPIDKDSVIKKIKYQNVAASNYFENAIKVIENSILDMPDGEYCFQVYREDDLEQDIMLGFMWKNKRFEKWIN